MSSQSRLRCIHLNSLRKIRKSCSGNSSMRKIKKLTMTLISQSVSQIISLIQQNLYLLKYSSYYDMLLSVKQRTGSMKITKISCKKEAV